MKKSMGYGKRVFVCFLAIVGMIAVFGATSFAEDVHMAPYKINLKSVGSSEDIQAVISMSMESGYSLADFEVSLSLNGEFVALAETFRYCPIDDNFLAGFDKIEVITNPVVVALANQTAEATVEGWFTAVNAEGDSYTREFSGADTVEIVEPTGQKTGQKKGK